MEKKTVYTLVDVEDHVPAQGVHVTWIMDNGFTYYGYMDESCGNWWAYIYDENGEVESMSPFDFTHWLEKQTDVFIFTEKELEQRDREVAAKAFEAGMIYEYEKHFGAIPPTEPNKGQYLNNLTTNQ